ncbi:probable elongator complex protein 2 [Coccinella septempunctata]|uniref:probable elongator complex protein 2 n=1 Tax=Coccinella septempunctata TaxID=41139 RepID=UPI001D08E0CB|nr:probable elongator complex protein 2 [Coccinella septempunctata]
MENDHLKSVYISTNCNQCTNCLHWGNNNLICYGSSNSICIYDLGIGSGGRVTKTLAKHKGQVNSVRWLKGSDIPDENEIVSGSTDGDVIVWTLDGENNKNEILKGHTSNVTVVDGIYKKENKKNAIVVSASMDSTVKVWLRENPSDNFSLIQTIELGYNLCISLRLFTLDTVDDRLLLALTLDDCSIRLFLEDENEIKFMPSVKLVGHEDWVCGLDLMKDGEDLLLASSGQDNYVRIWRFIKKEKGTVNPNRTLLRAQKCDYEINIESVLIGHEGWVYSVAWNPIDKTLLSASWDKTMVIWEYDKDNNLWMDNVRVGEVGGNTLGFYGGMFGPDGDTMVGYGYHGAFHVWKNDDIDWNPLVTVGGHFREVVDLAWDPKGSYIFSASADQTCRIHAPWPTEKQPITWHEIARPQVHGYDMNSIAVFTKYQYASASEEKVIRTFSAPQNFIENYKRICKVEEDDEDIKSETSGGAKGASVPSLGLSNKAVYSADNSEQSLVRNSKEMYPEESHFSATELYEPPTEENLLQNTLWPEMCKLYGHGYEVYCLASSPDGKYLASACKSTAQEHAAVLLWDTSNWKNTQKLVSHNLTVTQISFSPDSQKLLTVSRDRRWTVFEKNNEGQFTLAATTNKANGVHTRIIWCCSWTHDSKFFATGSRDGKLAVWTKNVNKSAENVLGQYELASNHLSFPKDSVTAVSAAPCLVQDKYLFAIGFESGIIFFYKWTVDDLWQSVLELNESVAHHLTVKRIQFRPILGEAGQTEKDENILQVATCSTDTSLKVFNLNLGKMR